MSTLNFTVPTTAGRLTTADAVTLYAAATVTTSWTATTHDVVCLGWDTVKFGITYINGDETSYQFRAEGYDGSTWRILSYKAAQSGTASEITPDNLNITKATINTYQGGTTAINLATPAFDCTAFQRVRMSMKSTGGTPTGTVAITCTPGISAAYTRKM